MSRRGSVFVVLALAVGVAAHAEIGAGVAVAYPIGPAVMYGDIYGGSLDPQPVFFGALGRWRRGALFTEAAVRYWPRGAMFHGNANVGVCGDLAFIRLGLSAGLDGILLPRAESNSVATGGWNLKLDIDVLIRRISVGFSVALPMDILGNLRRYGYALVEPLDELRTYGGQVSVNVLYRLGKLDRTRIR